MRYYIWLCSVDFFIVSIVSIVKKMKEIDIKINYLTENKSYPIFYRIIKILILGD